VEAKWLGLTCEVAASAEPDGEPVDSLSTASTVSCLAASDPEGGDGNEEADSSAFAALLDPTVAPLLADVFELGARTFDVFAGVKYLPPLEFEKNE